jgi:rare lipoprotein A
VTERGILQRTLVGTLLVLAVACAGPQIRRGAWQDPAGETGLASWYGEPYHGRRTSSGEVYDMYQLTAAHREVPLGSWVEVTNLQNGRSLTVRVNDRGPFIEGRIIDLSYAAASILGVVGPGVVPVRVRLARPAIDGRVPSPYTVQVGSFIVESSARALKAELDSRVPGARIVQAVVGGDVFYRVRVGRFSSRPDAQATAQRLARLGYQALIMEAD